MAEIFVAFKPNTAKGWAYKRLLQTGLLGSQIQEEFIRVKVGQNHYLFTVVSVPEEDRINYSRSIRMIPGVTGLSESNIAGTMTKGLVVGVIKTS